MSQQDIRYCSAEDGVRIAYSVQGSGLPIVICPFFIESFAYDYLVPEVGDFMEKLGRGRTLIRYDARDTGLSDRTLLLGQVPFLHDLSAVVEASGIEAFVVWSSGTSGPGAIEYAVTHPDRVSHLILFNTFARTAAAMDPSALEAMASLAESNWTLAAQTFADMSLRRDFPDAALRWSEVFRRSTSGEAVARGLRGESPTLDVTPMLGQVRASTLVFHRLDSGIAPFDEGQRMAAAIPGATFVALEGAAGHYSLGDTRPVFSAVDALLGDREGSDAIRPGGENPPATPALPAGTAIILFADVADSTALTERMGDTAFREKARALDDALRAAIREQGGTVIEGKLLGDGILATFPAASQAIAAALSLEAAAEPTGLGLHIGLHAGDVLREADADGRSNVFGGAVNIAARISALAPPGEVLVSDTVRSLARTSAGVTFDDRGDHALKGITEPQRVFAVRPAG